MNRASSPSSRRALHNLAPFRSTLNTSLKLALCCALAAASLLSPTLHAQTAYFNNTVTSVGSGFDYPRGLAVDGAGDVFVADTNNNEVKEIVAVKGIVSSGSQVKVLGSGFANPYAVAVDPAGDVFVADNYSVVKEIVAVNGAVSSTSQVNVVATGFNFPSSVALDGAGNVFVADFDNSEVKEIVAVNGAVSSSSQVIVVGTGFDYPSGVAVDAAGDVFVADNNDGTVKEMVAVNGTITSQPEILTVGTGFDYPYFVAVDAAGNVFVADITDVIKEIVAVNGVVSSTLTVVPAGTASSSPFGLALDAAGDIFVGAAKENLVEDIQANVGKFATAAVATTTPPVLSLMFTFTAGGSIAAPSVLTQGTPARDFTDAGTGSCTTNGTAHSYVAGDTCTVDVAFIPKAPGLRYGAAVLKNSSGTAIATGYVQGTGFGPQVAFPPGTVTTLPLAVTNPFSIAADVAGNLYIADAAAVGNPNSVMKETLTGSGYTQSTVASGLTYPVGVAVDGAGNVYIADQDTSQVLKYSPVSGGAYTQTAAFSNLGNVEGVAVDGGGNVYIASLAYFLIKETLTNGTYVQSTIPTAGIYPYGIAVDGNGNIYYTQNGSHLYKETLSYGTYTQSVIDSGLGRAIGLALDGTGNFYVADIGNNAVVKETVSGSTYTESTIASLDSVIGVAVDPSGNVYACSDSGNTVWKVDLADPPSLTFAPTAFDSTSSDSPMTVTLANTGNAPLTFPAPATADNPTISSNFSLKTSGSPACPLVASGSPSGTLAAGTSCQFAVSFAPVAVGALMGSLRVTDNNLNAPAPAYATQSIPLSGTAVRAPPAITWTTPTAISYGTPLSTTQLNATATIAGTFAYTPAAGTVLPAGPQTLSVTFTPANSTDYTTATFTVTLTVNQAVPTITWATPAAISYGTALSATQLNAAASVAGSFAYSPAVGMVLTAGPQTLSVTFTPTDATDYTTATSTVNLTVNQVKPTLKWPTPAAIPFGTALTANQLNATASVPGSFTYSPAQGAVLNAGPQILSATFTPTDITDYTTATSTVTLTVTPVAPTLTFSPIPTVPDGIAPFTVSATSPSTGAVTYSVTSGPATIAGNTITVTGLGTIVLTATQAASGNYTAATATTSFLVNLPFVLGTTSATTASVAPGAATSFSLTLTPSENTFPDPITFSATGLPPGATATFSPATIPAGTALTAVSFTIQTTTATARNQPPASGNPLAPVLLSFLLLPLLGLKSVRERLRRMPRLPAALLAIGLSFAAFGIAGCGSAAPPPPQTYAVVVTATDTVTKAQTTLNFTLTVE